MRLWRVVLLLNLALGAGLLLGYLAWGRPLARLAEEASPAGQPATVPGIEQVFSARGVVRGVVPDLGVVILSHEDIQGFMPAMTMGFTVTDPGLLTAVQAGDVVRFTLRGVPPRMAISEMSRQGRS